MTTRESGGDRDDRFESLFNRYCARIIGYFRKVFGVSVAEAKELTQDTFFRFYKKMDEYGREAEWALLLEIARNVGLNDVRSSATIKRGSIRPESLDGGEFPKDAVDDTQKHPIDTMIETEQLQQMYEAIKDLPDGQRRCILLWLEDRSGEEIARILRISEIAVKSRIRDAKRALRERLGDETALPED
jgi:RNA polymerase sigma factor (sigma-70 family)